MSLRQEQGRRERAALRELFSPGSVSASHEDKNCSGSSWSGSSTSLPALAQDADHAWSKTYTVTGKPTLNLETSDAGVQITSCGECREIRIHVEVVGQKLSDYRLEESQTGNQIHFLLKERDHIGVHITWHKVETRVTVETPTELTLEAKTSDGSVSLNGLQGEIGSDNG